MTKMAKDSERALHDYMKSAERRRAFQPIALIVLAAVLPFALLAVLAWLYPLVNKPPYPNVPSTLVELRLAISSTIHGWSGNDSFWPMNKAMSVLEGPMRSRLYEQLFFNQHVRFQYPVSSLLPLMVLSKIGLAGEHAFNILNTLVFLANALTNAALAWLLFPMQSEQPLARPLRTMVALLSGMATLIFYPLIRAQFLGQLQLWIDLLFSASVVFWYLNRRFIAGLLIGAICMLKPQMALMMIWGVLWREWKFLLGVFAFSAPVLIVSIASFGLHNHLEYLEVLAFLSKHGESFYSNYSLNGIMNWYAVGLDAFIFHTHAFPTYSPYIAAGTITASLAALLALAMPPILSKNRNANIYSFGAAAICTVVGAPIAWDHHYGILFPLYFLALKFLISVAERRDFIIGLFSVWISWVLVANVIGYAYLSIATPFAFIQAYCFFGAIMLSGYLLVAAHKSESDVLPKPLAANPTRSRKKWL